LIVTSDNYETESIFFTFSNQESLDLTVYVINSTYIKTGFVEVLVLDDNGAPLEDVTVQAKQWDVNQSDYIRVSEEKTGTDGKGELNIILDDKIYKFRAFQGGTSIESNEQIITTANNGKTITLTLIVDAEDIRNYEFEKVTTNVTESFNNLTNTTTITFEWNNEEGTDLTGCINAYRVQSYQLQRISTDCTTSSSATKVKSYTLNISGYSYKVIAEFKQGNSYYAVEEFNYYSEGNIFEILRENNLHWFILIALNIVSIWGGIRLENIFIGTMGLIISSLLSIVIAPTLVTTTVAGFLFFIGAVTLYGGARP
jgi:hypothetical protein